MNLLATMTFLLAQADEQGASWWQTIQKGGLVGYVILGLSVIALALIIMHFVQIRRTALIPPHQLEALDALLAQGDAGAALEYCLDPANDTYLTRILVSGLTRYQKSAFGAFEIKNAIEEAADEQSARLYRSTDALGVIGHIAPLLGLLGTVIGMVGAFDSLARSAAKDSEALASNISLALVTTLMGLVLAIPCIALFTYFRNRIDALASEASLEIEQLTLYLESAPTGGSRTSPTTTARTIIGGTASAGRTGPAGAKTGSTFSSGDGPR